MAITFVGSLVGTHSSTGFAPSVPFSNLRDASNAAPTIQAGDLVIVEVSMASVAARTAAQLTPTGYTAATAALYSNDSFDTNLLVSYKFMGSTPDTAVAIPVSSSSTVACGYRITVLRGVDPTTPLDVTPTTAIGNNTGVPNPPAITPVTSSAWILVAAASGTAAGVAYTRPADLSATTNHFLSATTGTTVTNGITLGGGLKTDWASGAFDPVAFGGSTTTNTGSWAAATIALRPKPPPVAILDQDAFRFYADGTESGSTPLAAQNANIPHDDDAAIFQLRVRVRETGGLANGSGTYNLYYQKNGAGSWLPVTASSADVKATGSPNVDENALTTSRLTGATGTMGNGKVDELGDGSPSIVNAGGYIEVLYSIALIPADVIPTDTLDFRVYKGSTPLDSYTATPRVTVFAAATQISVAENAQLFYDGGWSGAAPTLTGPDAAQFKFYYSAFDDLNYLTFSGSGATNARDFEAPDDTGTNNVYDVTINGVPHQVTVTDVAETVQISVAEETPLNYDLQVISAPTIGGVDAAQFTTFYDINGDTYFLRFSGTNARNYEAPADDGGNNVYDLTVNGTPYRVTVTNVAEGGGTVTPFSWGVIF